MITVDDDTLAMYIEESRDHLGDIEQDVLAIEQSGADIDENLVNKVFRAAHSIKGGAGFMGLTAIKELAHRLENVLGMIRSREMIPTPSIISTLLTGFDMLRELIENAKKSDEFDIERHLTALESLSTPKAASILDTQPPVEVHDPSGKPLFAVTKEEMNQGIKGGKYLYLLQFDLLHDFTADRTPFDLIKNISSGGDLLAVKVDTLAVGTLYDGISNILPFWILHSTILDSDFIGDVYQIPLERVYRLNYDKQAGKVISHFSLGEKLAQALVSASTLTAAATAEKKEQEVRQTKAEFPAEPLHDEAKIPSAGIEPRSIRTKPETSLRVHVSLLDNLMTLAGELVLSRNQLIQAKNARDNTIMDAVCQRIDLITSELQETIMLTRMQPIGNIFNKFPRVVRDLSRNLGKEVELLLEGSEVELDKTIIEGLNDPLTHLVRNSIDHGVEMPDQRRAAGKNPVGTLRLVAFHEAGQVNIEIIDDGAGIDPEKVLKTALKKGAVTEEQARLMTDQEKIGLIMLPGLSTAERVTEVSGRGVGMDVVKTNLDELGGAISIDSVKGAGTTIRIKLPLTLAIIPSQIVTSGGERFAIPQLNMNELLRIPAAQVKNRIERVGNADVVRLRGKLLPLVNLSDVLDIEKTFLDPETGARKSDRRERISDRRSHHSNLHLRDEAPEGAEEQQGASGSGQDDIRTDRRYRAASAINIVVVTTGPLSYGLVVDELNDAEEIVVKPLGRHLKQCSGYAGATIMGDGKVSLIIDVAGVSRMAQLASMERTERAAEVEREEASRYADNRHSLLTFHNTPDEQFAVPVELVLRIEKIRAEKIEELGGQRVIQYRGSSLPLFTISQVAKVKPLPEKEEYVVLVFSISGREIGLLAAGPVDATYVDLTVDMSTLKQPGISGSAIIDGATTMMVDIYDVIQILRPEWFKVQEAVKQSSGDRTKILLVEDSDFFRNQISGFLMRGGYQVETAVDGKEAWDMLSGNPNLADLIVTDIEMPRMDGFELVRKIKKDARLKELPIVAVTTRASDDDIRTGKEVGIDEYQIKLDQENLMEAISRAAKKARRA